MIYRRAPGTPMAILSAYSRGQLGLAETMRLLEVVHELTIITYIIYLGFSLPPALPRRSPTTGPDLAPELGDWARMAGEGAGSW